MELLLNMPKAVCSSHTVLSRCQHKHPIAGLRPGRARLPHSLYKAALPFSHNRRHLAVTSTSADSPQQPGEAGSTTVGEDAAVFDLSQQSATSWGIFLAILGAVTALMYASWVAPGLGLGEEFVAQIEAAMGSSEATMLAILAVFAVAHSGLAFLRPYGENVIGARAYRVGFALVSLPLAIAAVVFFLNHRYDGAALWNIR